MPYALLWVAQSHVVYAARCFVSPRGECLYALPLPRSASLCDMRRRRSFPSSSAFAPFFFISFLYVARRHFFFAISMRLHAMSHAMPQARHAYYIAGYAYVMRHVT